MRKKVAKKKSGISWHKYTISANAASHMRAIGDFDFAGKDGILFWEFPEKERMGGRMIAYKTGLFLLAAAMPLLASFGEMFKIEPATLYRARQRCDIQFYDDSGRALQPGRYAGAVLAPSPARAAYSNVELDRVDVDHKGILVDDPAFWTEKSGVATNTGSHVAVKRGGFAVSVPVPAIYDLRHTPDPSDPRKGYNREAIYRIWYDIDHREIGMTNTKHLGCEHAPKDAVYVRFLIPWSRYGNFRQLRLVRAYFPGGHPLSLEKDESFSSRFGGMHTEYHPGEIVLGEANDGRELYAASELVRDVKAITGKTLAVVSSPTPSSEFHVFVGRGAAAKVGLLSNFLGGRNSLAKKLEGTDGYAIRRKGKCIYVFGDAPRGTIVAARRLLEQVSDFYWWRPDRESGLNYTKADRLDFLAARDAEDVPVFRLRTTSYGGNPYVPAYDDWAAHHGIFRTIGRGEVVDSYMYHGYCHGFYSSIGGNYLDLAFGHGGDKSEDMWPMADGKRRVGTHMGQPCYSNPKVMAQTLSSVNRILDNAPDEWDYFAFDYSDSWLCCECPGCLEPIPLPDGRLLECKSKSADKDPVFRSTRTYMVANEIARVVESRFPGKKTKMLAYIYTAAPPEIKLNKSLRVNYATYDTSSMRFPTMEQTEPALYAPESWAARTAKWCRIEPQALGMYEYFFTAAPAMFAEAAQTNLMQMATAGGRYSVHTQTQWDDDGKSSESFGQNCRLWDVNSMDQVLVAKLFWNPFADLKTLRREFLDKVYLEGSVEMEEYYNLFSKRWFDRTYKAWMNCHTPAPEVYSKFIIDAKIEEQLLSLLEKAMEKTSSPAAKKHLSRKISALREMRLATGRETLPFVPEMKEEWQYASSPQWNKAIVFDSFRDALPSNEEIAMEMARTPPMPSKVKTRVDFACDREYLYWRVDPGTSGGYVEMIFREGKPERMHYFYAGTNGVETGRIPMAAIRADKSSPIGYVIRRFDDSGNCSFARPDSNKTWAYPGESARSFSSLDPAVESEFVEDPLLRRLGAEAKAPMAFGDGNLLTGPLAEMFPGVSRKDADVRMRKILGRQAVDTGYGYGFTKRFPAKEGEAYICKGDRWVYSGGFTPVVAWFYGKDGKKISDRGIDWEAGRKSGPFEFKFWCPEGTESFNLIVYDSYVLDFTVEKADSR